MTYIQEKQAAVAAVTRAAQLCTLVRTEMVDMNALEKVDKSPVTVADFGAQALVCHYLKLVFPADPIVAEEDSSQLQAEAGANLSQVTSYVQRFHEGVPPDTVCQWIDAGNGQVAPRFWTLDPIDGTKGFLRNDQYAIALALIENGEVKVAVLGCPALPLNLQEPEGEAGVLFTAVQGEGAAMAPLKGGPEIAIHVADTARESGLRFAESVEAAHGNQPLQQAIAEAVGITRPSLRMDSQAKYGIVARGDAALYLRLPSPRHPDYREKIWDHAAGALIITEAGGRVTDIHGQPLDFASGPKMLNNRGVIASNGLLHEAVLKALAKTSPGLSL
jgi:3'(2'), 5'-bisphosphate nucleotidase